MMVKFALFAVVTYMCYVLSDVVEFNPWFSNESLEVFCLGPFFALGLLAPPKSWTTALTKPSIQVVGVLVLVLCCASLQIQMPFARSLSPELFEHWLPREPVAAGRPERLLKHGLWFVYRSTWGFGVLWSVAAFTSLWASLAPRAAQRLLSGGSRSFYSYALHLGLLGLIQPYDDMERLPGFANPGFTPVREAIVLYGMATCIVLLLTSVLTEFLFSWAVMPLWLLDFPARLWDRFSHPQATNGSQAKASDTMCETPVVVSGTLMKQ
jgi:hypothetical protein